MPISIRSVAKWATFVLAVGAASTQATNYTVWVKGRGAAGAPGNRRAKWANHSVVFHDDGEAYNHYVNGTWSGIVSRMRADVAAYAQ